MPKETDTPTEVPAPEPTKAPVPEAPTSTKLTGEAKKRDDEVRANDTGVNWAAFPNV